MPLPPPRLVPLPKESTAARLRRAARQQGDLYEKSILNWAPPSKKSTGSGKPSGERRKWPRKNGKNAIRGCMR